MSSEASNLQEESVVTPLDVTSSPVDISNDIDSKQVPERTAETASSDSNAITVVPETPVTPPQQNTTIETNNPQNTGLTPVAAPQPNKTELTLSDAKWIIEKICSNSVFYTLFECAYFYRNMLFLQCPWM